MVVCSGAGIGCIVGSVVRPIESAGPQAEIRRVSDHGGVATGDGFTPGPNGKSYPVSSKRTILHDGARAAHVNAISLNIIN